MPVLQQYSLQDYNAKKAANPGQTFYNPGNGNLDIDQQTAQLLALQANHRDLVGPAANAYNDFVTGKISLEQAISLMGGTPVYDPTKGPQVDYGQGNQNFTGTFTPPAVTPVVSPTSATAPGGTISTSGNVPIPNITQNLGPGSQGDQVNALQTWLVQNGYMSAQDMATGPGVYGPKTTAAVAAWQKKSGIDTAGNPGYFGPRSMAYLTQAQNSGTSGGSSGTGGTGIGAGGTGIGGSAADGLDQDAIDGLKFLFGWTDEQVQQYAKDNPADVQHWAMTGEYLKKQNDLGIQARDASADAIRQAYDAASKDPLIIGKYRDIQATDQSNFSNNLASLQSSADVTAQNQKAQFEQDYKNLAETAAASGQAYSGFRQQATDKLGQQQSGVITSTRQGLKDSLTNMVSSLQQKYGSDQFSALFPNLTLNYNNPTGSAEAISPNMIPGQLQGTIGIQKAGDIANRQSQILQGIQPATT